MNRWTMTDGTHRWFDREQATAYQALNEDFCPDVREELFRTRLGRWIFRTESASGYLHQIVSPGWASAWLQRNEHTEAAAEAAVEDMNLEV